MDSQPNSYIEPILRRREIQSQIARLRRRLDRRANRLVERTLLLGSWHGYVRKYPTRSLLAATGVGFLLSGLIASNESSSQLGRRIYDSAIGSAWEPIWQLVRQWNTFSAPSGAPSGHSEQCSNQSDPQQDNQEAFDE